MSAPDDLPDDPDALRAALVAEQAARREAEARATGAEAMVAHLKLLIAKLKHDRFGASSERGRKLLDQLELELDELVTAASEDATEAEGPGSGPASRPTALPRRRPVRGPLPAHLPRERVVIAAPAACPCCGGKLSKLGEDITETLEVVPRQWKVIQTVRERFSCRACEAITQPPAPFHPIARGRAGPNLLAMVLEAKFGQHLPLNRQSETFAREGVELGVSTLADWVGTCTAMLRPLVALIEAHVLAAGRLHGDDTTVPLMASGKTVTARLWTYVRDDRPFAGPAPPAAMFRYSRDRTGEHPNRHLAGWRGILQADAYAGFHELYAADRKPGPILEAGCWAHGRRKLFKLAEVARAPLAAKAVRRMDAIFAVERALNGLPVAERLAARRERVAPLVADLEAWMRPARPAVPAHRPGQGDGLHAQALGGVHPVSRRRPDLPHEQRRRAGAAWRGPRAEGLAVRRQRSRRRAGRGDVLPHRHREAQRCRPARLARRCAGPDRRPPRLPAARAVALALEEGR